MKREIKRSRIVLTAIGYSPAACGTTPVQSHPAQNPSTFTNPGLSEDQLDWGRRRGQKLISQLGDGFLQTRQVLPALRNVQAVLERC